MSPLKIFVTASLSENNFDLLGLGLPSGMSISLDPIFKKAFIFSAGFQIWVVVDAVVVLWECGVWVPCGGGSGYRGWELPAG